MHSGAGALRIVGFNPLCSTRPRYTELWWVLYLPASKQEARANGVTFVKPGLCSVRGQEVPLWPKFIRTFEKVCMNYRHYPSQCTSCSHTHLDHALYPLIVISMSIPIDVLDIGNNYRCWSESEHPLGWCILDTGMHRLLMTTDGGHIHLLHSLLLRHGELQ